MMLFFYRWVVAPLCYGGVWLFSRIGIFKIRKSIYSVLCRHHEQVLEFCSFDQWNEFMEQNSLQSLSQKPILLHVASEGELECVMPWIQSLNEPLWISFFSGSVAQKLKQLMDSCKTIDMVFLMPPEWGNCSQGFLLQLFRQRNIPRSALFVKYDLWPSYIHQLERFNVPISLYAPLSLPRYLSWFGLSLNQILAAYEDNIELLTKKAICPIHFIGDLRVLRIEERLKTSPLLSKTRDAFVAGSLWKEDLPVIQSFFESEVQLQRYSRVFLVPHEPSEGEFFLKALESLKHPIRVIKTLDELVSLGDQSGTFLVSFKGILLHLYTLASASYVGGGWGKAAHSTLEPILAGSVTCCGSRVHHSPEVPFLVQKKYLTVFQKPSEIRPWLFHLKEQRGYLESNLSSDFFIHRNSLDRMNQALGVVSDHGGHGVCH